MRRGTRFGTAAAVALGALALSACSGGEPQAVPTGPEIGFEVTPSETETEDVDPWAAPDPLTEDYVRRVLTELESGSATFVRWLKDSDVGAQPPSGVANSMHATFVSTTSQSLIDSIVQAYADSGGDWSYLHDPYGQYLPGVVVIHRGDPACPLIEVVWDSAEVETEATPTRRGTEFVVLGHQGSGAPVNETGWVYTRIFRGDEISEADLDAELESGSLCAS